MRYRNNILEALALLTLGACSADNTPTTEEATQGVKLSSTIKHFISESDSRVNIEGTAFETNDLIRIKVICPYVSSTEFGETTWSNSYDGFWLQRWNGSTWTNVPESFGFDVNGDYQPSSALSLIGQILSQQTPYVFTASTWTEEKAFVTKNNLVLQYANVFHADQSREAHYKASDVLWAQNIMQTGTDEVHLTFDHVMAALRITIGSSVTLSDKATLTITGMPDIDQAEIIVGDMYAEKSKINSTCGYKEKHQCSANENGKVLGIGINQESAGTSYTRSFTEIEQTATYKALRKESQVFQLIVPPCTLTNKAVIWVRDGEKKWSVDLSQTTFEQDYLYNITLDLQTSTEEDSE